MHALVRPLLILLCAILWSGLWSALADPAQAQTPPATLQAQRPIEALQQRIDQAIKTVQDLSRAATGPSVPDGIKQAVGALDEELADVRMRAIQVASGSDARRDAIISLLWLTAAFVVISGGVLLILSFLVRRDFWGQAAAGADATWRSYLLQLPLGAPEGSVRALVSMYVIVFGLLVLVMQEQLGLTNVEAISGFVGIVITFYFTARTTDQAAKAVSGAVDAASSAASAANQATQQAQQVASQARQTLDQTREQVQTAVTAAQRAADNVQTAVQTAGQSGDPAVTSAQSQLQSVKSGLQTGMQVLDALGSLGVGTGVIADVKTMAQTASGLVDVIDPLLSGRPDLAKITDVLGKAENVLGTLDNAGLPGVVGDAVAGIGGTLGALAPLLGGAAGGPAGLVTGIIITGVKLLQQRQKFEAWKAALLRTPLNRSLMPTTVDGTAALAALDPEVAPLMAQRLGTINQGQATELMRQMLRTDSAGDPLPSATLAAELFAPGQPLGLHDKFQSEQELAEAIDQYRSGIVFANARTELQGSVDIPAIGNQPAHSADIGGLLTNAVKLAADPRAASEIERLVYLVEAFGKLGFGTDRLVSLAVDALGKGIGLATQGREQTDQRQ